MRQWDKLSAQEQRQRRTLQLLREEEWKEQALLKYKKSIMETGEAPVCIENAIDENASYFAEALKDYVLTVADKDGRFADWITQVMTVGPEAISYIVVRAVLDTSIHSLLSSSDDDNEELNHFRLPLAQNVAREIAKNVVTLKQWFEAKDAQPEFFRYQERFFKSWNARRRRAFIKRVDAWRTPTQKMQDAFGHGMIRLAEQYDLIRLEKVEVKNTRNNKMKTMLHVALNEQLLTYLRTRVDDYVNNLSPNRLPMLCRPVAWSENDYGGFTDFTLRGTRRMSGRSGDGKRAEDYEFLGPTTVRVINALQATEWRINDRVLEVMKTLWELGEEFGSAPSSHSDEIEDSGPRPDREDKQAFAEWKDSRAKAWAKWFKAENARVQHALRLREARTLEQYGVFWHAWFCDFRGRFYADSYLLHPQGGDLDKALIMAAEPEYCADPYWIKVNLANLFGVDKCSFDDRVAWVDSRMDEWRMIERDPVSTRADWEDDAPKKNASFQRLAAICDLIEVVDGSGYTSVPVQIDGSCNGIQHWAALTRDEVVGPEVNLTPGDKPADIYQLVADDCGKRCMEEQDDRGWHEQFIAHYTNEDTGEFKIPRSVCKRSVMCDPYGITPHSVIKYVLQEKHMDWAGDKLKRAAASAMGRLICLSKDHVMQHCNNGKLFVQHLCKWVNSHTSQPLEWITPSGFRCVNMYNELEVRPSRERIWNKDFTLNTTYKLHFGSYTPDYDADAAAQAMPPNYVHSIDASHMALTTDALLDMGVEFFSHIHDSYGVLAPFVPMLREVTKEKFHEIHVQPQLNILLQRAQELVGQRLPANHPAYGHYVRRGELDIDRVLESEYLFG